MNECYAFAYILDVLIMQIEPHVKSIKLDPTIKCSQKASKQNSSGNWFGNKYCPITTSLAHPTG